MIQIWCLKCFIPFIKLKYVIHAAFFTLIFIRKNAGIDTEVSNEITHLYWNTRQHQQTIINTLIIPISLLNWPHFLSGSWLCYGRHFVHAPTCGAAIWYLRGGGRQKNWLKKVCFRYFVEKKFVSDQCFIKAHIKWLFKKKVSPECGKKVCFAGNLLPPIAAPLQWSAMPDGRRDISFSMPCYLLRSRALKITVNATKDT